MIRILLALSLIVLTIAPTAFAEDSTANLPALEAAEVAAPIDASPVTNELKRNELLFDTSYAGFEGYLDSKSEETNLSLGLGYNRALTRFLQLGGRVGYQNNYTSTTGSKGARSTALSGRAGPTFNVGTSKGIENAFFLGLYIEQVSIGYTSTSGSGYSMSYGGTFGKRFQLFENVSFTPHLYSKISRRYYDNSSYNYSSFSYGVQLLSASVLW